MQTGYRFDHFPPEIGSEIGAFRTLEACEQFVREQGGLRGGMRIWEIQGLLVSDEGGLDGLVIKVDRYSVVR